MWFVSDIHITHADWNSRLSLRGVRPGTSDVPRGNLLTCSSQVQSENVFFIFGPGDLYSIDPSDEHLPAGRQARDDMDGIFPRGRISLRYDSGRTLRSDIRAIVVKVVFVSTYRLTRISIRQPVSGVSAPARLGNLKLLECHLGNILPQTFCSVPRGW